MSVVSLSFVASATSLAPGTASPAGPPWLDTASRATVLDAYESEFKREASSMEWTGAYQGCEPGDSSDLLRQQSIRRVNFYRSMAGVPATVTENPEFSAKAQYGALMMSSEGTLSHTPDESYACYSETGAEAAGNSNLYLGRSGPSAIDGYIQDPGDRNRDVGHRNTILHPPTTEMGVGHVAGNDDLYRSNVLWVFDENVFSDPPPLRESDGFVAWPPRGYVPQELVHPRWSFGLVDANFDVAKVTMTINGEPVPHNVVARLSKPGHVPSPIIVWETSGPFNDLYEEEKRLAQDLTVSVSISNVLVDDVSRDFAYDVTIVGEKQRTDDTNLLAFTDQESNGLDIESTVKAVFWPASILSD